MPIISPPPFRYPIVSKLPYAPPQAFTSDPVRHLIYHIWPHTRTDIWKWNLACLKSRLDLFDGVRSIAIAVGPGTASVDEVKEELAEHRIDNWIILDNKPNMRETASFVPLMETLPRGINDVTFYAHAKGVRHHLESIAVIWAYAMYRLCLDDWPFVYEQLQQFPVTGAFKRHGEFRLAKHHRWHYTGTFYWFRNCEAFKLQWDDLAPNFFAGVEAWPARIWEASQGGCLFLDNCGNLYDKPTWQKLIPDLQKRGINLDLTGIR